MEKIVKSEAEWEKLLTPEQYKILRQKGTESPFTGKYWHNKEKGMYRCGACGSPLFPSDTKFDSGTGWPSFYAPADEKNIECRVDESLGTIRTEVVCQNCGGHLGHVFDDGPKPTGKRFCIKEPLKNMLSTAICKLWLQTGPLASLAVPSSSPYHHLIRLPRWFSVFAQSLQIS